MRVKETPEELEARSFFEKFQYTVTRISEAEDAQTADYRAQDGPERFIVEVKSRGPDVEFARQLEYSSVAGSEKPMARTNTISRQVRDAADQLSATDPGDLSTCRLIVFVASGDDPDLQVDQFQKTIYGAVDLVSEESSATTALPCFYFTFSDFFRFRQLDGAVVLSPRGARLCVNTFGKGRNLLRDSRLYSKLSAASAVTDPDQLADREQAYLADTDIDRRNESAVLTFVREKYGRPELLTFKPTKITVATRVPYESMGLADE